MLQYTYKFEVVLREQKYAIYKSHIAMKLFVQFVICPCFLIPSEYSKMELKGYVI